MKKLIEIAYKTQLASQIVIMSIAFVMCIFSCKKETPEPDNRCDCSEVTFIRWTYTQQQWVEDSRTNAVKMDCWKHGEILQEWQITQNGMPQFRKRQIVCE